MKIGNFKFKEGKIYTIAEIGKNHNGSIDKAKRLIELAYYEGCDAVKFQAYHTDHLMHTYSESGAEPDLEWLRQCELQPVELMDMKKLCDNMGITFLATPESEVWVDVLAHSLHVSAFKVSSLNINNFRMLYKIASKELPVILSTGMSYMDDVDQAVSCLRTTDYALLHCVSQYPAELESLNLSAMRSMRNRYQVPVGFSDHTIGGVGSQLAVHLGAEILEFHITLDNRDDGPDHSFSLNPTELSSLMGGLKRIQEIRGNGIKQPHEAELAGGYTAQKRRCCVAARNIQQGAIIENDDIICLCPGDNQYVSAGEIFKIINGQYIALEAIPKGTPIRKGAVGRKSCPRDASPSS